MTDLNDTTAIADVVKALKLADELAALPGIRNLGDLRAALERGDIAPKELAQAVKKALKA